MKLVLAGGSGLLGGHLSRFFQDAGHHIVILSRRIPEQSTASASVRWVPWDAMNLGSWVRELEDADVVVNLAGRSVNCRMNEVNRREVMQSRTDSTRAIGKAIDACSNPPKLWLQSSTATIYRHEFDRDNDEFTGTLDGGGYRERAWRYSIEVAKAWEQACIDANTPNTRKVLMRISLIMSPEPNSVFDVMLGLTRKGLGGAMGDGRQYISWMHYIDFVRAVQFIIDHPIEGPVNLASPEPLPNREFMRILRKVAGVRIGLPAYRWMLEIGAIVMRTESELILKSRRVAPGVLLKHGFGFSFPSWEVAAADLFRRWSAVRAGSQPALEHT